MDLSLGIVLLHISVFLVVAQMHLDVVSDETDH